MLPAVELALIGFGLCVKVALKGKVPEGARASAQSESAAALKKASSEMTEAFLTGLPARCLLR
jgi:hypothetical protein